MMPASTFLNCPPGQITPVLEEEFFTSLRMRNGTYKTTFQNRFSEVDRELRALMESGAIRLDDVLDIGISSGTSTLDLYENMSQSGHEPRIVATDLMTEAWLVQVFPGCFALVDEAGYPLRYDLFNWSMKPWVIRNDYRSGFFVVRKGINIVFGHRATSLLRKSSSTKIRKVGLVTPRLLGHANIVVREDDIMKYNEAFDRKFSFVRAANILNKGYFTDVELRGAIGNIRQYLATDAALLVVRTHQDGQNHGTLFTIGSGGNCKVLRRFGDGSEIEEIVLECVWNASVG